MSFPNKVSYEASRVIDNVKMSVEKSVEFVSKISYEDAWLNAYNLAKEKAEKTLEETIRKMDKEDLCVVKLKGNQGNQGPRGPKGPQGEVGPSYKNLSLYYTLNNTEDIKNFNLEVPKSPTDPHYYSIINNVPNPYEFAPLSNLVSGPQTINLNKSLNNVKGSDGVTGNMGTNNSVNALAIDTANNLLYVGGQFTYVNGVESDAINANYIASWNYSTSEWAPLTYTITDSGGVTTTYNGVSSYVYTLCFDTSSKLLYIGGNFLNMEPSGPTLNNIAVWDGTTMYALEDETYGIGVNNQGTGSQSSVGCITIDSSGNVYMGGNFTYAGDTINLQVNYITYWVPGTLNDDTNTMSGTFYALTDSTYGTGFNTNLFCITLDTSSTNGNIYIGGYFTYTGTTDSTGLLVNYITYWVPGTLSNNTMSGSWNALTDSTYGTGVSNYVLSITIDSSNNVYIGGAFKYAGDTSVLQVNNITYWVPGTYTSNIMSGSFYALTDSSYGIGVSDQVNCITFNTSSTPTSVYIGGNFIYTGTGSSGLTLNYITYWVPGTGTLSDNTMSGSWNALTDSNYGTGVTASVKTILYNSSTTAFIGGDFTYAGESTEVNYIAQASPTNYTIQLTDSVKGVANKSTTPICPSSIKLGDQYTTNVIRYDKCFELVSIVQGKPISNQT